MHTTPRFLQGSYHFEGQGLCKPVPIDPALSYAVPARVTGQVLYFRGGNSTAEMITVLLMRDGQPMRYFPIGARGGTHVPLRVVEDLISGTPARIARCRAGGMRGHRNCRFRPGGGVRSMRELVVAGNGMAGARAVEEILTRGGGVIFRITMFGDEPHGNYNRILLSDVLARGGEPDDNLVGEDLFLNPRQWYRDNGITLQAGVRVVRIDRFGRRVYADDGSIVRYDKPVLATGSRS